MDKVINNQSVYRLKILSDNWVFEETGSVIQPIGHIKEVFPVFLQQEKHKTIIINGIVYELNDKQYNRLLKDIKRESFLNRWKVGIGLGCVGLLFFSIYTAFHLSIFFYQYYSSAPVKSQPLLQNESSQMMKQMLQNEMAIPPITQPVGHKGVDESEFWKQIESMER